MSKEIGPAMPRALLDFLRQAVPEEKFRQVILFTTLDEDGWPRHGMLSPWEVVGRETRRILMLLYRASRGCRNVLRDGRVSLIVVNPKMSYYLLCRARPREPLPEAPQEALFDLTVERVLEDSLPTARIATGLTFEGHDPGMTRENREAVFRRLTAL